MWSLCESVKQAGMNRSGSVRASRNRELKLRIVVSRGEAHRGQVPFEFFIGVFLQKCDEPGGIGCELRRRVVGGLLIEFEEFEPQVDQELGGIAADLLVVRAKQLAKYRHG